MAGVKRSERTKVMINNFMTEHNNGLSIPEIADKYSLSKVTVYRLLDEIAEKEGVTRDDLLKVVHVHASDAVWQRRHEETKRHLADIKEDISRTKVHTENLLDVINSIIMEGEKEL